MKLMKTKLGLSVLALALVGAGAWSLQSPVTASAEVDMSGFKMENGASVCLSGVDVNEKKFNGIRWTTTVEPSFYTSVNANRGSEFGVIVAPTKLFTGELTFETTLTNGSQVKKLPVKDIDATSEAKKYYSVIDYSELGDPSEAYKLELTARAYVDVDGDLTTTEDCYYADMTGINTSRSARQVAVSAELAGVVEDNDMAKAKEYYGEDENVTAKEGFVESTGAVGTQYIDMEKSTANLSITLDGSVIEDVLVGSEVMANYSYDNGTLTLNDLSGISCGEQYLTVFTDNGLFVEPIIGATKVFDEIEDFDDFKYVRKSQTNKFKISASTSITTDPDGNELDRSLLLHDGYYVLADDLDATSYDTSDYTYENADYQFAGWLGGREFMTEISYKVQYELNQNFGLTGTFNGLGHTVSNLNMKRKNSGLFEIINGGTVKNFSLDNLSLSGSYSTGLANYAFDPTIENVRIVAPALSTNSRNFSMFYYLYQTKDYATKMTNVFVSTNYTTATKNQGGLFGNMLGESKTTFDWDNVYSLSNVGLSLNFTSSAITTYAYGEEQKTGDDTYNVYKVGGTEYAGTAPTTVWYFQGAHQYYTVETWKTGVTESALDAFKNDKSGCWEITYSEDTGYVPTFKQA